LWFISDRSNDVRNGFFVAEQFPKIGGRFEEVRCEFALVNGHLAEPFLLHGLCQNVLFNGPLADQSVDGHIPGLPNLKISYLFIGTVYNQNDDLITRWHLSCAWASIV
jgi:hypothetical protein